VSPASGSVGALAWYPRPPTTRADRGDRRSGAGRERSCRRTPSMTRPRPRGTRLAADLGPARAALRRRHADRPSEIEQIRRACERRPSALDPEHDPITLDKAQRVPHRLRNRHLPLRRDPHRNLHSHSLPSEKSKDTPHGFSSAGPSGDQPTPERPRRSCRATAGRENGDFIGSSAIFRNSRYVRCSRFGATSRRTLQCS
jgi:hypothetical protein